MRRDESGRLAGLRAHALLRLWSAGSSIVAAEETV